MLIVLPRKLTELSISIPSSVFHVKDQWLSSPLRGLIPKSRWQHSIQTFAEQPMAMMIVGHRNCKGIGKLWPGWELNLWPFRINHHCSKDWATRPDGSRPWVLKIINFCCIILSWNDEMVQSWAVWHWKSID